MTKDIIISDYKIVTGDMCNSNNMVKMHMEFIVGCNRRGSKSSRYVSTANLCKPVPPFTRDGLAHLASLLSDQNTASGGVQRHPMVPDKSKQWAMGFLSYFNPNGYCKINDPIFLEFFARQIVDGESCFQPE